MYAVSVTCCKNTYCGRALGDEFAAITYAGPCRYISQAHDAGAQAHDRLEREQAFGLSTLLQGS